LFRLKTSFSLFYFIFLWLLASYNTECESSLNKFKKMTITPCDTVRIIFFFLFFFIKIPQIRNPRQQIEIITKQKRTEVYERSFKSLNLLKIVVDLSIFSKLKYPPKKW